MRVLKTNISINIQYKSIKELESALYSILNELESGGNYGEKQIEDVSFNYAKEVFEVRELSDGTIEKIIKSKAWEK